MSEIRREREVRIAGSAPDPGLAHRGIGVALSALLAVLLPSCLITQPVHFDEPPNSPPAIYDTAASPIFQMNTIGRIPNSRIVATGDAGGPTSVPFSVVVYDPDVDQTLHYAALVDMNTTPCSGCNGDLTPSTLSTGRERRTLSFDVPYDVFQPSRLGCHRVRLIVTGDFQSGTALPRDPVNDTAIATWWIAVQPPMMSSSPVDMTACPL
jgi:hypothetical protein